MSALPPTSANVPVSSDDTLSCPDCGYDLRGIDRSDRCPECGLAIDRDEIATSRIPWTHRARIGRVRAYLRTVRLATINTKVLAREVARPVSYRDAQRFRIVTSLIAAAAPALAAGFAVWRYADELTSNADLTNLSSLSATSGSRPFPGALDLALPWFAGATLWPVLPLAIALFALTATGLPSYWFHPAKLPVVRQNRAVALSYYACAPLVLLLVPAACYGLMALMGEPRNSQPVSVRTFILLAVAAPVTAVIVLLGFYVSTIRLLRRTTQASTGRIVSAIVGMPAAWLACAVVTLFAVPWTVGFVRLVLDG